MFKFRFFPRFIIIIGLIVISTSSVFSQDSETVVNEDSGKEYRTGLELYRQRKYTEALPHFVKAFELDERNTAALFAQALSLNNLGKYKEAADVLKKLLSLEPSHEKAIQLYPIVLERNGQSEAALAAYDKVIEVKPDDADAYWGKARVYYRMQQNKEALANLDKAVERDPANLKIKLLRAQTLVNLGKMKEAAATAEEILEKNPNDARARVIAADWKRQQGKLEEALEDYTLAAKNIETKAYAEHFIEVIKQQMEEEEIEREYQERLKREQKQKTPASGATVSSGQNKKISGDNLFGCANQNDFKKLVKYTVQKDNEAFKKALAESVLAGTCTMFKNGEVVYIVDTAILSGLVKVRRKGETLEYWTIIEAIE